MPTVCAEATMWGLARVFRNGEMINDAAPFHMMLTSASRGADFNYMCYTCTSNEITQVHLVSRSPGGVRDQLFDESIAPGGFLHLTWEQSTFTRQDS
jgi:hypothetical protein